MAVEMHSGCGNLLNTYLRKVKHVTAHWKMLGALLGLDKCCLDGIEEQYRNVVDNCMLEMLDAWLKTNPSNTEEQLEDALKELSPACRVRSAYHGKNYMHTPDSINFKVALSTGDHPAATMTISCSTQRQIVDFKNRFAHLAMGAMDYLKKSYPDTENLIVLLNDLLKGDLKEPLMIEQPVATHIDLFLLLQTKWSFTNPTILQQLINYLAGEDLQQKMTKYSQEYDSFCQSLKINESSIQRGIHFDDYDTTNPYLIVIIESGPLNFNEIYLFLDNVFGIYKRYLRLHKIEPGCIKVTLQFPPSMTQLIQACIDQKSEAVKRYAKMELKLLTDVIEKS